MQENIKRVAEFHKVTDSPVLDAPAIPSRSRIDLRADLLEEEVSELRAAAYKGDLAGVLDAICDIQYVLDGTILEFGLQDVVEEGKAEVHRSNMSKFCDTTRDAQASAHDYIFNKDVDAAYKKVGNKFVVYRFEDKKILKGIHFSEPKLKEIIKKHIQQLKKK